MDWHALKARRGDPGAALVLLVEDDDGLRELWANALTAVGYEVRAVPDALTAMAHLPDAPQVAVCDVHLPGASGLWLTEQIRTISPTTAVVLATGDARIPATQSLRSGIVRYLVKPFGLDDLKRAVEEGVRWSLRLK
jgi:DNA-binding NtrC family response regulator